MGEGKDFGRKVSGEVRVVREEKMKERRKGDGEKTIEQGKARKELKGACLNAALSVGYLRCRGGSVQQSQCARVRLREARQRRWRQGKRACFISHVRMDPRRVTPARECVVPLSFLESCLRVQLSVFRIVTSIIRWMR